MEMPLAVHALDLRLIGTGVVCGEINGELDIEETPESKF
jgi:hypothetical protein